MKRRGRPPRRRPVDSLAIGELDPDAADLLDSAEARADLRRLAQEATDRMYADRRSLF